MHRRPPTALSKSQRAQRLRLHPRLERLAARPAPLAGDLPSVRTLLGPPSRWWWVLPALFAALFALVVLVDLLNPN